MAEQNFLQETGVTVTSARFVIPSQTYALSGVTSVKNLKETASKKWPIVLIVVGVLTLLGGISGSAGAAVVGLLVGGAGVAWLVSSKPTYYVVLNSSSGEARSLSSKDEAFILRVINALNEAIVHRG